MFPDVNVNLGDGYDSATGEFTVPPGGAGVYFFYFYTQVDILEYAAFSIRRISIDLCSCEGDHESNSGDQTSALCGAVAELNQGKSSFHFLYFFTMNKS